MAKKSLSQINFSFNGASFLLDVADGKMMSLNEIYAAAGSPAFREPFEWLRSEESKRFIENIMLELKLEKSRIMKVTRGKGGGTWAHWKIATKYAAYLNPAIESAILEVFQERIQEEIDPGKAIDRGIEGYRRQGRSGKWIDSRLRSAAGWNALTDTLKTHDVVKQGYAKVADAINVPIIGKTAKEFKQENGLKKSDSTRDKMDMVDLNMIALTQSLADKKIVDKDVRGNKDCAKTCFDIATRVAKLKEPE